MASAASSLVAPARAAAWACEAMQPSHLATTPIASAMSSLVFLSNAPAVNAAPLNSAKPRSHLTVPGSRSSQRVCATALPEAEQAVRRHLPRPSWRNCSWHWPEPAVVAR
jgi:hypothetical protein